MSEDVSKDDIEENNDQDEEEEEEENNATAAFANNENTNRTNKSTKKAFGELTFSKGDDFIVESLPNNNLPNKDNIQQPQQNVKSVTFNNPEGIKHQPFQFSNSNYNEISNIMNEQLLISKSSLLTNIKEVQAININDVNTAIANNANNNQIVNENKVKSEVNVDNTQSNNESTKMKRNSMNSGLGEMWIPPSSLNNTLNNINNNVVNDNINLILPQEQPRPQIQIQSQPQPININQSLQIINKELDIITGNINESISGGRFYNKRNNYGCSCYDGSLLLRNSTNDYTQYIQNDIMTRKYNPNQPSHIHNSLSIPPTQTQIHNSYFNNNNNNSVITSSRTTSKTNSRVLYNIQDSSQTNLFT